MSGKLIENLKLQRIMESQQVTAGTTLYNGAAATTGNSIDTKGYDEIVIALDAGLVSAGSYVASVVEYASDDPASATAITSATFGTIDNSADQAGKVGSIVCRDTERHLWLKIVPTSATFQASAWAVLGKPASEPTSNSESFDV